MAVDRQAHWDSVYATKAENELSWFQASPVASLDIIHSLGLRGGASIIDIGGGTSRLVDALLDEDCDVTVLDLSATALAAAKTRLGARSCRVHWLAVDVTTWEPTQTYDLWHDRAAFHFLTEPADRDAYAARLRHALHPGGHAIIATFAPDGPERCSGLPVLRHDAASIGALLGKDFELIEERRQDHQTPSGNVQRFQCAHFRRKI